MGSLEEAVDMNIPIYGGNCLVSNGVIERFSGWMEGVDRFVHA